MTDQQSYTPINCSYYDYLEEVATLKRQVLIEFYRNATKVEVLSGVSTLYTTSGMEFMVLTTGEEVRLDKLISFDGHRLPINSQC